MIVFLINSILVVAILDGIDILKSLIKKEVRIIQLIKLIVILVQLIVTCWFVFSN